MIYISIPNGLALNYTIKIRKNRHYKNCSEMVLRSSPQLPTSAEQMQ